MQKNDTKGALTPEQILACITHLKVGDKILININGKHTLVQILKFYPSLIEVLLPNDTRRTFQHHVFVYNT